MIVRNARRIRFWVSVCMMALVASLPLAFAQEKGKSLDGKQVFEQKCLKCHKPEKFKTQHHSREGWEQILTRMELNTCVLTDAEASAVAAFLAKEFGD